MRISDWSSDVCSSDLGSSPLPTFSFGARPYGAWALFRHSAALGRLLSTKRVRSVADHRPSVDSTAYQIAMALSMSRRADRQIGFGVQRTSMAKVTGHNQRQGVSRDRKSTRLHSSQ